MEAVSKNIKVKEVSLVLRAIDLLLTPIMLLVNGFKFDSIQETHTWHSQNLNPDLIDLKSTVLMQGDEEVRFKKHGGVFFHIPILGGWKKYVVFEIENSVKHWHVGWYCVDPQNDKFLKCQIQKLKISDKNIKLLNGSKNLKCYIFALDENGNQICLKAVDKGTIGDNKYRNTRLF